MEPVRIPLLDRHRRPRAYALVDAEDAPALLAYAWAYDSGYAIRHQGYRGSPKVWMHREIVGLPREFDGREVDHINRDKLDNRRENLREATRKQNAQNMPLTVANTSGYRNVHADKYGRWRVTVKLDGRTRHLGSFADKAEAAAVAERWRMEHMPYAASAAV